jgi:hypothetical protein
MLARGGLGDTLLEVRPVDAMHRIFHDFNKIVPSKFAGMCSAPLVCVGTRDDLQALGVTLQDGMGVLLYQPDDVAPDGSPDCLQVRATVRFDHEARCFVGDFVWEELKYRSEAELEITREKPDKQG